MTSAAVVTRSVSIRALKSWLAKHPRDVSRPLIEAELRRLTTDQGTPNA